MHDYTIGKPQDGVESLPPLEEAYSTEVVKVVAGDPQQSGRFDIASEEHGVAGGVWEVTPGSFDLVYPFYELATILSGRIIVTDESGERHEFKAGDSFLARQGESVNWDVLETTRKAYLSWTEPRS